MAAWKRAFGGHFARHLVATACTATNSVGLGDAGGSAGFVLLSVQGGFKVPSAWNFRGKSTGYGGAFQIGVPSTAHACGFHLELPDRGYTLSNRGVGVETTIMINGQPLRDSNVHRAGLRRATSRTLKNAKHDRSERRWIGARSRPGPRCGSGPV
jgi:hypothetical protein